MTKAPDDFGDRMKGFELVGEGERLNPQLPIYARLDGRSFSRFTRGLDRPFDVNFSQAMIATMAALIDKTHACLGYTQSDEISLVYLAESPESDVLFNGRIQKLASVLAGLCTALFTREVYCNAVLWTKRDLMPHFDCRVCQMPSKTEAANMFLWRWKDSTKNAIQMVAQENFSPKQLHGKHGGEMIGMLRNEKGIEFKEFPGFFRRGTFGRRVADFRELTAEELERIPEKHRPTGPVQRHRIDTFVSEDLFEIDRESFVFRAPPPPAD